MSEEIGGPAPGTTLAGKYLVERTLGIGGMGVVVSAMHLQLDQRVALKYLLPDALKNPEVVERFAREAKAAAKIRGEHVARVIDVGRFDDGAPYIVMEYLDGHDLGKQLEEHGPLPIHDAIRYLLETCEALAEAHAAKIVHRDLKPSNLFLATQPDRRKIVKVLDFGISKMGDAGAAALTRTQAMMGTAYYMSPEQMMSPKDIDHRSDIWALGVILYELLAGHQPFRGETVAEIIAQILQNEPEGIQKVRPEVPDGLAQVIEKCMQSKAVHRWEDVAELAHALAPYGGAGDRISVSAISRVLGKNSHPPEKPVSAMAAATAMPGQKVPPIVPTSTPRSGSESKATILNAMPVAVQTAHGLSHSSMGIAPPKKMSPFVFLSAAGLLVGIVGAGALVMKKSAKPVPEPTTGVIAQPSTTAPMPPPLDPTPITTAATATATAKAEPVASVAPSASSARGPIVAPEHRPVGVYTPVVASPKPSAAPPPPPPENKNPLEIKIK